MQKEEVVLVDKTLWLQLIWLLIAGKTTIETTKFITLEQKNPLRHKNILDSTLHLLKCDILSARLEIAACCHGFMTNARFAGSQQIYFFQLKKYCNIIYFIFFLE